MIRTQFAICSVSSYITEALAILTVKYSAATSALFFFLSLFALPFKTDEKNHTFSWADNSGS